MLSTQSKPRILIVDDEEKNLRILKAALEDEFSIDLATTGKDAIIAAMSEPRPDLILLDVVMPEMHGFAACERLKENMNTADIPVIFVTSLGETADETRGLEVGAVDYITKPYNIPVIKARVRVHTRLKQHERFVQSLLKSPDQALEETKSRARELFRQLGNE